MVVGENVGGSVKLNSGAFLKVGAIVVGKVVDGISVGVAVGGVVGSLVGENVGI
jgi:hypothetical protein